MEFWSQVGHLLDTLRPEVLSHSHSEKIWVVDNLLLDHDGLPHVLGLAVHLVIFLPCWVGGIIPRHFYC